jgi:nicotinate phosphoribosyltransferase
MEGQGELSPGRSALLLDMYQLTMAPELPRRGAAAVGRELRGNGHLLTGVRLDSGDLAELARETRAVLDAAGLTGTLIFASGSLDEYDVAELLGAGAPIDGFGLGSKVATAADAPFLDMAYKLVEFDGRPVLELSATKATWPGPKQVRRGIADGLFAGDLVEHAGEPGPKGSEPLLMQVMADGKRSRSPSLEDARARCSEQREQLAGRHRSLAAEPYAVELSERLHRLRDRTATEVRRLHGLAEPP